MKKLMISFAVLAYVMGCCSGAGVQGDQVKQIAVQSAARMLGYKIAEAHGTLVDPTKTFCRLLSTGSVDDAIVEMAKSFLIRNTKDSVLVATLTDVIDLVKITTGGTENKGIYNPELVKMAALYVMDGISIYEKSNSRENGREQDTGVALYEKPTKEIGYDC